MIFDCCIEGPSQADTWQIGGIFCFRCHYRASRHCVIPLVSSQVAPGPLLKTVEGQSSFLKRSLPSKLTIWQHCLFSLIARSELHLSKGRALEFHAASSMTTR